MTITNTTPSVPPEVAASQLLFQIGTASLGIFDEVSSRTFTLTLAGRMLQKGQGFSSSPARRP